jgi:hypothetical protein
MPFYRTPAPGPTVEKSRQRFEKETAAGLILGRLVNHFNHDIDSTY